jgi:hypothetical protein
MGERLRVEGRALYGERKRYRLESHRSDFRIMKDHPRFPSAVLLLSALLSLPACSSSDSAGAAANADAASSGAGGAATGNGGTPGGGGGSGRPSTGGSAGTGGTRASDSGPPTGPDATVPAGPACAPLPVTGHVVNADTSADLPSVVRSAASGDTILLADGTYKLGGVILQMSTDHVALRSKSGNREAVILDGERSAATGEVIAVTASDVTVADLTIANAYTHAIHVQTTDASDVLRTTIFNVHVLDALEQGIKINENGAGTHFTDDGTIACSHIELTSAGRPQVRNNCYTGGIDGHGARGWRVRDNLIEGFYCAQGLSEHGVHFWTGSRDTVVENNRIFNCARGVGFGLGETTGSSSDAWRTYTDKPCGAATPVGHYGGVVRNNFVFADAPALFASAAGFDSGIDFEQACLASAVHNTVFGATPPLSSAIEWRFLNSSATVINNLANAPFKNRGNGATETASGNVATATAGLFVDASSGDLHLAAPATGARGAGTAVAPGLADEDIDHDPRTAPRDVGADQMR